MSLSGLKSFWQARAQDIFCPPFVVSCAAYCLGIIGARWFRVPAVAWGAGLGLMLVVSVATFRRRAGAYLVFCSIFFLGAFNLGSRQFVPLCSLSRFVEKGKQSVVLKGAIVSDPLAAGNKTSFLFSARKILKTNYAVDVCGVVSVRTGSTSAYRYGSEYAYRYGDEWILKGSLYRAPPFLGAQAGVVLNVRDAAGSALRGGRGQGLFIKALAFKIKRRAEEILLRSTSSFCSSLLEAMLLGEKKEVPLKLKRAMIKTGTWHILVVSGSHTALVALIALMALKILRIPRRPRLCLAMGLVVLYCVITGSSAPVVRATVMTCVFLLSYLTERNPLFGNSFSLAAFVILIADPSQLFDVGFQLSFVSVFFIVWMSPKILKVIPASVVKVRTVSFFATMIAASLSAWVGTAPLIASVFGNFSLITVVANMIVLPLSTLVILSGLAVVFLGSISPSLAYLPALANQFLMSAFYEVNIGLAKLPFASFQVPRFSWPFVAAYYAIVFVVAFLAKATTSSSSSQGRS